MEVDSTANYKSLLGDDWPETRPLRVGIIAGEASGDAHAGAILSALSRLLSPVKIVAFGTGSAGLESAGGEVLINCDRFAAISFVSVIKNLPFLLLAIHRVKRAIVTRKPDVVILIDAGGINVRLGRWIKKNKHCPVFYYFPPGSWRRQLRKSDSGESRLINSCDRVVTPFPWSAQNLRDGGVDAHWVGHPILDLVVPKLTDEDFYARYGLDPQQPLITLMPGSRIQELIHILPAMVTAAGEISRRIPGVQFVLTLAPSAPRDMVESIIRREQRLGGAAAGLKLFMGKAGDRLAQIANSTLPQRSQRLVTNEGLLINNPHEDEHDQVRERVHHTHAPLVICEGVTYDALSRSDLVITKSGSSTLEAAVLLKPMIIVYRMPIGMRVEWFFRKKSINAPYIGLPNIIANEKIFPELIQGEATPEAIAELAVETLLHPERLLYIKQKLADMARKNLGEKGATERAAKLLCDLVKKERQQTPSEH